MINLDNKHHNFARIFFILNILFLISVAIYSLSPEAFSAKAKRSIFIDSFDKKVKLEGSVCQEPDLSYKNQKLVICYEGEKILVYSTLYPYYNYADFLEIEGKVTAPEVFSDFNYPKSLELRGIYSIFYYPKIKLLNSASHNPLNSKFRKVLISIRQSGRRVINKSMPEPEASLASAMLFGYKRSIDSDDSELFSEVGISHLLAISGAHIGILAAILLLIFSFLSLGRKTSFILISIFLFSYPIASGLSSSAIRASLMGFLAFLATACGRKNQAFRALIFSASLMLIFNPMLLGFDLAFQLSFSAVLGIILFESILKRVSDRLIENNFRSNFWKKVYSFIFSLLNLSISAQIFTWPIILLNFKKIPFISIFSNIFLAWTLPFILALLLIAIFLSFILPSLSLIFFWPSYVLINFVYFVSNFLSSLNFPMLHLEDPNYFIIFLYYFSLILFILYKKRKRGGRRRER